MEAGMVGEDTKQGGRQMNSPELGIGTYFNKGQFFVKIYSMKRSIILFISALAFLNSNAQQINGVFTNFAINN